MTFADAGLRLDELVGVQMALVVLGGVGAAVIGALLPALWAARSSVAMVLRAE